ncbi:hypothetical protein K7I13_00785 [Brucepastera parasyntrophica]|uniref:hypothetical protein n=1 Tax=Brucepastera parasyntrophica TaxID=2880008 RepID=UPI00210B6FB8|nr:hypothetical protein [Brucepastera parasyntrophica]ULQ59916.1 hypothetical protein K7I13_00785 [Brucepastera parasyntrophica]
MLDMDLAVYLNYIAGKQPLKTPPAFDQLGVLGQSAAPENNEFGDTKGAPSNFSNFSLRKASGNPADVISSELKERIYLMNPMNFINDGEKYYTVLTADKK